VSFLKTAFVEATQGRWPMGLGVLFSSFFAAHRVCRAAGCL